MRHRRLPLAALIAGTAALLVAGGCPGGSPATDSTNGAPATAPAGASTSRPAARASDAKRRFDLDTLSVIEISINTHVFRAWLALTPAQQTEGLMHVPTSEIADDQGMLFVFPDEQPRGFWMSNTIAPLDIAYADASGKIVKIWQMPPLTLQTFPSEKPAQFALEVKQGTFARLNIREGDTITLPPGLFKR